YGWPGNVRELQNVIERGVITAIDGPAGLERDNIARALARTAGKVSGAGGAAELLGMNPSTLASRIRALGLRPAG
ncbi:MAG: hypothetical protein K8M05_01630, partial [Deltaproteobacteria bacterium]|nr:hypothetical protein [Kofleriaceae bacterium]